MELEEREIPISELKPGMYVSRLDVPWELTSFPLQGIRIESSKDIQRLASYCQRVYIDLARQRSAEKPVDTHSPTQTRSTKKSVQSTKPAWKKHCAEKYNISTPQQKELNACTDIMNELERKVYHLCEHTLRCRSANVEQLLDSATQIVESVIRNPDALAWLCRVKKTRQPIHMHTMRLSVWGAIVGRQLGLNRYAITHICGALLMTGIGKSAIPEKALGGYSPFKCSIEYKKHLQETLYQLKQLKISDSNIYETLESYCERIDGTGYPDGIRENTIPFLSQVCGITEVFELLVNPYHMTRAISPAHAIIFINKFKGVLFEETLVEEFVRAIGLYPTGTLVEISDGQLGVIIAKNHKNKFRASVIPIINSQGEVIPKYTVLDLSYTKNIEHTFIRKGIPSSTIPRGLLENAHHWMFKNGTSIKSLIDTLF